MSCCPSAPAIRVASDTPPISGPENQLRPGETVECFSQRAGNTTGSLDDAVKARKNTIANESVPVNGAATVDVQFRLSSTSDATVSSWTLTGDVIAPVTLSSTGRLQGTFPSNLHGKKVTITVTALFSAPALNDAGESKTFDERTYSFSPVIRTNSDSIELVFPMNGGIINSPYGMRNHPIQNVPKLHPGVDIIHKTIKGVNHPILAAADGVVIKAKNTDPNGYGNAIHIRHTNSRGEHLCTTTYNHLFKYLVQEGDKVSAGQQIALEGGAVGVPGSGGSTGLHLHFECRLPNGSFVDPAPFFRSAVEVSGNQIAAGVPDPSTSTTVSPSGASLNSADVAARTGCPDPANYPDAPGNPDRPSSPTPPGNSSSAFENAWYFTMLWEVGPHWNVPAGTTPSDTDIVQGLIDTPAQRKKCGWKSWAKQEGGDTKFGITSAAKPKVPVKDITYEESKQIGYYGYWARGAINPSALPTYLGIFMFDTNFNHGEGNGRTMYNTAGLSAGPWPDKASQMADLEKLYQRRLQFVQSLKNKDIILGVSRRVTDCYNFVRNLTL